jgi:WD40 repeat protein
MMRCSGRVRRAALVLWLGGCGASSGAAPVDAGSKASPAPHPPAWDECGTLTLDPDPSNPAREVTGLAVSPDGRLLVGASFVKAHAWHLADELGASTYAWGVSTGNEKFAAFSPDGTLVAISGDGRALVDVASGAKVFTPNLSAAPVLDGAYMAFFDFSPDGRRVAGSGYDYFVDVFDTTTHERLAMLPAGNLDTGAAFSPNGSLLATGIPELYRTSDWTRVWPAAVTREQPTDTGSYPVENVVFTPDGQEFVVSRCVQDLVLERQQCTNTLFLAQTGRAERPLPLSGARPAFSADGDLLITGGDIVWKLSGSDVTHLGDFTAGAFAPNDDVFVGTADGLVKRFCVRR